MICAVLNTAVYYIIKTEEFGDGLHETSFSKVSGIKKGDE